MSNEDMSVTGEMSFRFSYKLIATSFAYIVQDKNVKTFRLCPEE
ncbi:hypothetical protein WN51_03887 [Melipona quadrifasciata]|uniref:Uncharacterized protein n=1 Tax=Melipona quadrifasciata TaxID=166423 RepID=A0A0N0U305_9HYME|nr:hypothetical protein WN51_03887 [Melipona quadrifasciata]